MLECDACRWSTSRRPASIASRCQAACGWTAMTRRAGRSSSVRPATLTRSPASTHTRCHGDQAAIPDPHARPRAIRAPEPLPGCRDDGNRIAPALGGGDRGAALLHLPRLPLGDAREAVVSCPACEARLEAELRVSDLP